MANENIAEKVEIYETTWYRYREDSRLSNRSDGFYSSHAAAERALARVKKRAGHDFASGKVVPRIVIKIGDKMYEIWSEYQIPRTFADPSQIEKTTERWADLDLGEGLIAHIRTEPLKIK